MYHRVRRIVERWVPGLGLKASPGMTLENTHQIGILMISS